MRRLLRAILPKQALAAYHWLMAQLASRWYRQPSRRMVVIGVTGTDGKTTTAMMIAECIAAAGYRVGMSTSVYIQDGTKRWMNATHMTMPGEWPLQRLLKTMVRNACTHAVLEISSEGLAQNRHAALDVDIAVITNLTPEHIKTHGSLANYRAAKARLFEAVAAAQPKRVAGRSVPQASVVNLDDPEHKYFLQQPVPIRYGVTQAQHLSPSATDIIQAEHVRAAPGDSTFTVNGQPVRLPLPGAYNVSNALEAWAVGRVLGIDPAVMAGALEKMPPIPGRHETVPNTRGLNIIVDYALTPAALEQFYQSFQQPRERVIAVFGAAGGGRDIWKRPVLGEVASRYANRIILTADDPYNDDPQEICDEIKAGIPPSYGGRVDIIVDRQAAIKAAVAAAKAGDTVAITGMGAEMSMMVKGKAVPWSDAEAAQEALQSV